MKYLLIFLANFDYSSKCNEVIEYTTDMHNKDTRMIPDDYIELIKYWTGGHYYKFSDFQTYPDNWGCHNKEILSFIFKERYCEISDLYDDNTSYMSIRIYPTSSRRIM